MAIIPQHSRIYLGAPGVTLTVKMKEVLGAIASGDSPLFVAGKAGTGKSTLLRYIQGLAHRPVAILGPTGVSAVNVHGMTIHSFFRFPPRLLSQYEFKRHSVLEVLCKKLEGIIIDEISMVRADMLDAIDATLRLHRCDNRPFGGVQMIFFGDLAQLPPVVADEALKKHFTTVYESPFFFDAYCLRIQPLVHHELTDVLRQRDLQFVEILNRVSVGASTPNDLRELNRRVDSQSRLRRPNAIVLTTTNRSAKATNKSRLDELSGKMLEYHAAIKGNVNKDAYPTNEVLELKPGCRVMLLANNGSKWNNGTLGRVVGQGRHEGDEALQVEVRGTVYSVIRHTWEIIRYTPQGDSTALEEKVVGTFRQFPVKLAWAVTIHKSQGLTFDEVIIDLDRGTFDHGQLYVALSRCRRLDGISLVVPVRMTDLQVHPRVDWFHRQL